MKSSSYVIIFIKTHAESFPSSGEHEGTGEGLVRRRILRENALSVQKKENKVAHENFIGPPLALRTELILCKVIISVQSWIHFQPRSSVDDVGQTSS